MTPSSPGPRDLVQKTLFYLEYAFSRLSKPAAEEASYIDLLSSIKTHIAQSRIRAYRAANKELINNLYLFIGKEIAKRQEKEGWGKSVVERLSADLQRSFPETNGLSVSNVWFMRQCYAEYRDTPILLQLVREIPWGQNIVIMTKVKDPAEREYYLRATAEMAWSRNVLLNQIKGDAYIRHQKAKKQHNFEKALPKHLVEQADKATSEMVPDPLKGATKEGPRFRRIYRQPEAPLVRLSARRAHRSCNKYQAAAETTPERFERRYL